MGPGTFVEHRNFGENLGNITIGYRRGQRSPEGPGPCDYSPEHSVTKPRKPNADFTKSAGRLDQQIDANMGPGTYTVK